MLVVKVISKHQPRKTDLQSNQSTPVVLQRSLTLEI